MKKNRKTYTREFKIEAVKLSRNSDKNVDEIAESLGVSQRSFSCSPPSSISTEEL